MKYYVKLLALMMLLAVVQSVRTRSASASSTPSTPQPNARPRSNSAPRPPAPPPATAMSKYTYFQYDIVGWNRNPELLKKSSLMSWNIKSAVGGTATIVLDQRSPMKAYFSYQSAGQNWSDLQAVELTVPINPQWPFVFTTPIEGCGWIIAKFRDRLMIYHDRHPLRDYANKMTQIHQKGPTQIIRVDDVAVKRQIDALRSPIPFTSYLYGHGGGLTGAQMLLDFEGRWRLHIQDMKIEIPRTGDAIPTNKYIISGPQRSYDL